MDDEKWISVKANAWLPERVRQEFQKICEQKGTSIDVIIGAFIRYYMENPW